MASTLKEISHAAGTSVSTASLILNGRQAHRFTEATQAAVIKAADQLGYRPQRAAQSLVTGKTSNVAVIVNSLTNPFFARYASLIQAGLVKQGFTATPIEIRSEEMQSKGMWMEWIDQRAVDAVIDLQGVMQIGAKMAKVYNKFSEHRPIVFRQLIDCPELATHAGVIVDYTSGYQAMAKHLAEIGCREVGFVTVRGHLPLPYRDEKVNAGHGQFPAMIQRALDDARLNCPDHYFRGVSDERADSNDWCECTYDLLSKEPQIQSLIVHNLDAVPATLHGIRLAGRELGRDLSLVSFDDMPLARWLGPGITVVHEPAREVAAAMVDLVLNEMAGERPAGHKRVLSTRLHIRGSTDSSWLPHSPHRDSFAK
ncbi:MAG: LacI family DNA-binding transcriptional regulator [Planctomycetota bacterium]